MENPIFEEAGREPSSKLLAESKSFELRVSEPLRMAFIYDKTEDEFVWEYESEYPGLINRLNQEMGK